MVTSFDQHPSVTALRSQTRQPRPGTLSTEELRRLCLEAGADDAGFVPIDRPDIASERAGVLQVFPSAKVLISVVCRMNREPVRSPARSIANLEFHHSGDRVNEVARDIVRRLEDRGIRAMNAPMGFPMETSQFPGKIWVVSHKPVAVAAGLGQMGLHRNVIHPRYGSFILLGTIFVDVDIDQDSKPVDYNPCVNCKLCVAACPVGAIKPEGGFDASACVTHNYREFLHGFTDWVEHVADSHDAKDYRRRVTDQESVSMWQSLSFGANYKAAYCLAVCPAGEDVLAPFVDDRPAFLAGIVKPLQQKQETIYVVPGSDADEYVTRVFPHKTKQHVNSLRPTTITGFLDTMHVVFQAGQAKGIDAVYHLIFTGKEPAEATVTIRQQTLHVQRGLIGKPDCMIKADSQTWLGFLRKERRIGWAILTGRIRVRGGLSRLQAFGRCFPG
jgi:NAD-dependent dihydropyrimidine dehydrogenase PreA subunit